MLDRQIAKLKSIMLDEDLKKYAGDAFLNLISCVISADPIAGIKIIAALRGRYFSFSQIISYVVVQSSKICFRLLTAQL